MHTIDTPQPDDDRPPVYPEPRTQPSAEELGQLAHALGAEDDPFLTASYNHLAAREALILTLQELSPEQTLAEQNQTIQQAYTVINGLYAPTVQQLTKGYIRQLQPNALQEPLDPTLEPELDPGLLDCLADLTKTDAQAVLAAIRDIAPHAFPPGYVHTTAEITQSIEAICQNIAATYRKHANKDEVADIFCRSFTDGLTYAHGEIIQKAFESIPAADSTTIPQQPSATPEVTAAEPPAQAHGHNPERQQPNSETQTPHHSWRQEIGSAALKALSIAAGVAAGNLLSAAIGKRCGSSKRR